MTSRTTGVLHLLSFFNHTSFQIIFVIEPVLIHSPAYNIYGDALYLLRILTGLMFAKEHVLGYDQPYAED